MNHLNTSEDAGGIMTQGHDCFAVTNRVYKFEYQGVVFWDRELRLFDQQLLTHLVKSGTAPAYSNIHLPKVRPGDLGHVVP
jgi:hypothetical protein